MEETSITASTSDSSTKKVLPDAKIPFNQLCHFFEKMSKARSKFLSE